MTENELFFAAKEAVKTLENHKKTLALAESCTGGLVSKLITDVSGASAVYEGGVCSYSNSVKMKILGVKEETLRTFGAVSENTAREMSQGVRKALGADIGVGITGIAGPLSDGTNKPVGLIYISVCSEKSEKTVELKNNFTENVREQNRLSAAKTALDLISEDELYE
ncbi:MAG: CinA family protein [Oscillospiraceae bacterium]|nr:CinA family protein [Oscillospiraceae bacterium]MDD7470264.1 CinA family protein [Oscillospiraceae bacterium]MDY2677824.1 CinA family protein [Oscillospiraceae bacterium]